MVCSCITMCVVFTVVVVFRIFHLVKKEEVVVSDLIRETSNKISGIVLILYITISYIYKRSTNNDSARAN